MDYYNKSIYQKLYSVSLELSAGKLDKAMMLYLFRALQLHVNYAVRQGTESKRSIYALP